MDLARTISVGTAALNHLQCSPDTLIRRIKDGRVPGRRKPLSDYWVVCAAFVHAARRSTSTPHCPYLHEHSCARCKLPCPG